VELFAGGAKYQVWAVPVSLRQRKRATRNASRAAAAGDPGNSRGAGLLGMSRGGPGAPDPTRAWSDQVADSLQETAERNAALPGASGPVVITWCWWIIAPTLAGLIALVTLIAAG
jgi:hypothetical protein